MPSPIECNICGNDDPDEVDECENCDACVCIKCETNGHCPRCQHENDDDGNPAERRSGA